MQLNKENTILVRYILIAVFFCIGSLAHAAKYDLHYHFTYLPSEQAVDVVIQINNPGWLKSARFDFESYDISQLQAKGKLTRKGDAVSWQPASKNAQLKYRIKVNHQRKSGSYDAYMGERWSLLRGEDLIPPVKITKLKNANVNVTMKFHLPNDWASVNTGWERIDERSFLIENKRYAFARPSGWIIAGDLGTRHEQLEGTQISISAPQGQNFRQMEMLVFVSLIWPEFRKVLNVDTPKILITGAGKPMWRGGLSGPNSLYIHRGRPLVSENGTSTLIHELFHVVSRIDSSHNCDWIVEGLAEFYSIEILYRSGGMSLERRAYSFDQLKAWSQDVTSLLGQAAKGPVTAKSALLFEELNAEIIKNSNDKYSLDDVVKKIQNQKSISLKLLQNAVEGLTGVESKVLNSPLLKSAQH